MPIEDFLVDFYSKNTDQEIDQAKIDSIIDHYDGDNASMMKDLYEKYDNGNIDNNKFLEIKDYYSIDLPNQEKVQEVEDVSNPDFDYTTIINDKKNSFDQGEFKMAEREAYDAYKETGEIDLTLLPKEEVESARKYKYNEIGGEYYVDNVKLSRVELKDKLYDRDFIDKLQGGKVDIKIKDDERLEELAKKQLESGSQLGDKWEGLQAAGLSLGKSIISAPSFIEDVFAEVTGVENVFGEFERKKRDEMVKMMAKDIDKLHDDQRAYKNDFRGSIGEFLTTGNTNGLLDAGNIGFNTVVESAPIMVASTAAAIASGGSSVVAQGLASAGVMSALLIPGEYTESVFSEDEKIQNLSRKEKLARGFFRGLSEGVFEGVMGPAGGRAFGLFKSGLKSTAKAAAKQGGKKAGEVVAREMANKTAVDVLKTFGIDSGKEGFTEALTSLSQDLTDDILGVQDLSISEYMSRASEAGALGIFMGGVIQASGGTVRKTFDLLPLRNKKVYQGSITDIRKRQELGTMSKEEGDRIINDLKEYESALEQTDSNLNEKEQNEIANLIYERNILEEGIKKLDPNQQSVKDAKARVDNINKKISELSATDGDINLANKKIKVFENTNEIIDKDTDNRLDENIEFAERESKKFGLRTEVIDSQIEFTERFGEDAGRSDGFIDNGVLYINKEVAKNTGAVTVGSHELLHGILNQAFKGKDAKKLVSEFKKRLNKNQLKAIDDRLLALDENGDRLYSDEYLEANQDEVLTAFSDAIAKEEISYDENLFTKLMDVIVPILRKAGFAKIKFETGKDVYNFLKEYNKSVKEGKLSESISELSTKETIADEKTNKNKDKKSLNLDEESDLNEEAALVEVTKEIEKSNNTLSKKEKGEYSSFQIPIIDRGTKTTDPKIIAGGQTKTFSKLIDKIIASGIKNGKTLEQIQDNILTRFGWNMSQQFEVIKFIKGKIDGSIKNDFNSWRLGKPKPDSSKKFSKTKENKEIKEIFDEFTGPAENRKFKSKEEFKGIPKLNEKGEIVYDEKGEIVYSKKPAKEFFAALKEIEQSETLDASIRNIVGKSYLDMNPGFVKEVKEKISDKFKSEYDASKNSLFGWLTGKNISGQPLINRAAGDIQIKRGKKPSTVSADQKIGGEESRVTIGETLVSDEISPEDYADMMLVQDKLKKIKPQQSKIAKKIDLTKNELNLVKRDITNFLRKSDRPAMTDPKKFFKAFVDYMSTATGNRLYDKLSGTKDGLLSTKNRKAFIESIAEDLIALNKVDPSVMRRSNWTPFYELEIKRMNPTQTQKAIDEGRIPSTVNLKAGNDLFRTLDPSVDQVVDYLMGIRPDVLKRKMPKFLAEVIAKNEFNDIVDNPNQPVYDTKGDLTDRTIDLSENITEEEIVRGAPQVIEKIARPAGVKFSKTRLKKPSKIEDIVLNAGLEQRSYENYISDQYFWSKFSKDVGGKNYDFNNPEQLEKWKKDEFPKLVKIFSKDFLINSGAFFGNKGYPFKAKEDRADRPSHKQYFIDYLNDNFNDSDYGAAFEFEKTVDGKKVKFDPLPIAFKKHGQKTSKFNKYFGSKENIENNDIKERVLKEIFLRIQNAGVDIVPAAVGMLRTTSKEQSHFMRKISPITFRQLGLGNLFSGEITEEHALGASLVAKQALLLASDKLVNDNFTGITRNYFQGPISKVNDNKVNAKELGMKEGPQKEDLYRVLIGEISGWIRYAKVPGFNLNTIETLDNNGNKIILTDFYNVGVDSKYRNNPDVIAFQNSLIEDQIANGLDPKAAKELLNEYLKLVPQKTKAGKFSKSVLSESKVLNLEGDLSMQELLGKAASIDQALSIARDINAPVKKIRVFDFDDTLATTKSNVLFTAPDGTEGSLTAEKFAMDGARLLEEGYSFDFTEFDKVTKGKPGPLLDLAKKIQDARGTEDVFVLTARAPQAAIAIKEFLDSQGLNIPLENITGLGKSTGEAKANWMVDKAAEGYNDFYFADDALQNVKAVKNVMSVIDVKSKVQQAKFSKSKDLSSDFNKLIEESTGIGAEKVFSDVKAKLRGGDKKGQRFFIPPSAEDMLGLVYTTLGKGKKGEAHMKFYQENLFDPYTRAMDNLSTDRVNLMADFKALKKELNVPKDLRKTTDSGFTNEQAVRVYLWNKAGEKIPGLSNADLKELSDIVENNPKLKVFADQIMSITKGDGYSTPKEAWALGTITTDLVDILNTTKRSKYLESWNQNVDLIYSKDNLNKLEAAYGKKYRDAIENSLGRMKSGSNRLTGGNKLSNDVLDYINNSTAVTMFVNVRSALLQTLSSANFINWSFNNPLKAGKAFANQPQFWKDFTMLMNSDYLVDRRNGLKLNINESEIANAAKTSKNKAKAALNYILEKGFLPTKYADSFAIASGGATFYRNRINDLIKNEGLTKSEAEVRAMKEFRAESEKSQQSSDPSKISSQQASYLGRIILQYVNTPMQYARLQKRDVQDMVNRRALPGKTLAQSNRTRLSRIAYYAFIQNLMFNALQQAVFAIGFGDDGIDEEDEKKLVKTLNGMIDSSLRGLGFAGVTVQVLKNLGIDIYERSKRDRPEYTDSYKKLLEFSPAIKSKLSKFESAAYPFDSKKRREEVFEKGFSLDNPAYESMAKVVTATTNVPLDRLFKKVNNLKAAASEDAEAWQSVAMVLGWSEWQIKERKNYVEIPKTEEEKLKIKEDKSKTILKEAKGSTDYETLKKLNKKQQLRLLKNLGVGGYNLKKYKKLKEDELIKIIIKKNKK